MPKAASEGVGAFFRVMTAKNYGMLIFSVCYCTGMPWRKRDFAAARFGAPTTNRRFYNPGQPLVSPPALEWQILLQVAGERPGGCARSYGFCISHRDSRL